MRPTALWLAIEEANRLTSTGVKWAEVDNTVPSRTVLRWGAILSNGQWERAIAHRVYEEGEPVKVGSVIAEL